MDKNIVTIREFSTGDWEELLLNGKFIAEGHSINIRDWTNLLKKLGVEVIVEEVECCSHCDGEIPKNGKVDTCVCGMKNVCEDCNEYCKTADDD